jgi:hypothetical protein
MQQVLDSSAPFDFFSKNGYYTINDKIALHIGVACQEATRTRHPIQWHFNDDAFASIDWTQTWGVHISEVYRRRAQQLRDKYNYIILALSGGADSTTILESFLYNNIHLDEVVVVWPYSLTHGKYTPTNNPDPRNTVSEWYFSVQPKLEWLAKNHPEVKLTILDQMADMRPGESFDNKWTVLESHNFGSMTRQIAIDEELKKRQEKHHDVVLITGSSPPRISLLDNRYLAVSFNSRDATCAMGKTDYIDSSTFRNVEYFYWTPDMPELVREQAHLLLDHLNKNFQDRELFATYHLKTNQRNEKVRDAVVNQARRELIKKIVYPNWITETFQAFKAMDNYHKSEVYRWFFYDKEESDQYLQGWQHAMNSQYALIDPLFISAVGQDLYTFPIFYSKFHIVGTLSDLTVN